MSETTREFLRECERLELVGEEDSTIVDLDRREVPLRVELSDVDVSNSEESAEASLLLEFRWSEERNDLQ